MPTSVVKLPPQLSGIHTNIINRSGKRYIMSRTGKNIYSAVELGLLFRENYTDRNKNKYCGVLILPRLFFTAALRSTADGIQNCLL